MQQSGTTLSALSDDEYLQYLYNKKEPTAEDLESALRIEQILEHHRSCMEELHRNAVAALRDGSESMLRKVVIDTRDMSAPVCLAVEPVLHAVQ
jgi:phage shock protein A